ncbi:GTP-binding protein [Brevibacterium antiquum]|uniref:CobW family GTP-binding protein n=1 Tax=Brevibacterium antiquum TaxID=234835 RepID=UPI0018E02311|nr:GTP-binding protein [Brevibacterium antiquum]
MIELTVIGGYLGAGKTTLLNEILDRQDGERVAVIVNDFGTVNIDAEIIGSVDGRAWEIANGCICCDLSDGMAAAIESIRNAEPPVSRVYIEVSGVGRPEVVARWGSHPGFARGGSVVCADVISVRRDVSRKWVGETVASQLRGADRLLLTKTDLVGPEQIEDVRQWLGSQPGIDAEFVDRDQVLAGARVPGTQAAARPGCSTVDAAGNASVSDPDPSHETRTHSSWSVTITSAVDPAQLRCLVLDLPEPFVRVKGILADKRNVGQQMLVQFDGTRFETQALASHDVGGHEGKPTGGMNDPGHSAGRLVLIAAGDYPGTPEAVTTLAHALGGRVDNQT